MIKSEIGLQVIYVQHACCTFSAPPCTNMFRYFAVCLVARDTFSIIISVLLLLISRFSALY